MIFNIPPANSCFFLYAVTQIFVLTMFELVTSVVEESFDAIPIFELDIFAISNLATDFSPTETPLSPQ